LPNNTNFSADLFESPTELLPLYILMHILSNIFANGKMYMDM
jgi:hypothetical protein